MLSLSPSRTWQTALCRFFLFTHIKRCVVLSYTFTWTLIIEIPYLSMHFPQAVDTRMCQVL